MTDHKDQETPGRKPVAPSDTANHRAIISAEQPVQKSTEEENMEVHHHAHHSGPKNWKSYIREFLMLFLAVFCGFLAEYQLEHTVEHDREEQYIESMISDMREDSVKIIGSLAYCNRQKLAFDSIISNIYHRPYTDSSLKYLYFLQLNYTNARNPVAFTKRTITQLQNSGGLRLIRNKAASDSIISYNEDCNKAENQAEFFAMVRMGKVNDFALNLFDNHFMLDNQGNYNKNFLTDSTKVVLLNEEEKLIKQYANALIYARGSLKSYILFLQGIQASIPSKIRFLEENYH